MTEIPEEDIYEATTNAATNDDGMTSIPDWPFAPPVPPPFYKRIIRKLRDRIGYRLHWLAAKVDGHYWESW